MAGQKAYKASFKKEFMKKYEAVIILNPNLSSKVDEFKKDFDKLLYDCWTHCK